MKLFKSGLVWSWITILVLILDRLTKMAAIHHLNYLTPFHVLSFLDFTLSYNTGAAFSFLQNASGWQNWLLGGSALIISVVMVYWLVALPRQSYWLNIALCLVLGGALGNAWDRVLYGYVIDFLSFHLGGWYFAIFNMADSAISVGAFMLFCHWIKAPRTQTE